MRGEASQDAVPADLIERCKQGDEDAWRQLVEATQRDVYTLCYRILRNSDDAAEATQDAYLRAWRGLRSFRGDAQFTTWLYRVAANAALTKHRGRARKRTYETEADELLAGSPASSNVELEVTQRIDLETLERAVGALPDLYRLPVLLKDVYGLSVAEVADRLKISETVAKVRLHRARKQLRERLFPMRGEEEARAV